MRQYKIDFQSSNFFVKNGGSQEDAKDVFQNSLMIILEKVQSSDFKLTSSFLYLSF